MNRSVAHGILALILASLLAGCAPKHTAWDRLYSELSEDPERVGTEILKGRRIVLDPGHGGYFEGATGIDSLTEAEVNLGVALYLWGLLDEAGAEVLMTRSTDRDFLPDSSITLEDDLAERMRISNSFDPEVFLSLHHNSNISLDRRKNMIEVYYRGSDPDASLELATDIQKHLARNLGIEESKIRPGNYYVLRNSMAGASVLAEASYISHPEMEKRLKISSKQKLEAESYFLGLVSYFSRGIPIIERVPLASDTITGPGTVSFTVLPDHGIPIDPSSLRIIAGDDEIPSVWDPLSGRLSHAMPHDAPNMRYSFRASARSVKGGSALSKPFDLLLNRPVRHILPLSCENSPDRSLSLTVKLLDALGEQVADGKPVRVIHPASGKIIEGSSREGTFTFTAAEDAIDSEFILETSDLGDTLYFRKEKSDDILSIMVTCRLSGKKVDDPFAICPDGTVYSQGRNGFLSVPADLSDGSIIVSAPGYRPIIMENASSAGSSDGWRLVLDPILGGAFQGKIISIDPAGGGIDDSGRGPMRLRGATVNLEIAKRLRDILTTAGADVTLTREGEETLSLDERIYRTNISGAELALRLHFGSESTLKDDEPIFLHYPGSSKGRRAALSMMDFTGRIPPFRNPAIAESANLFLQQTKAPSCELHAAMTEKSESLFSSDVWMQMQVQGIVAGLVRYFLPESIICLDRRITLVRGGSPVRNASISIDGIFSSVTDSDGKAIFRFLDEGRHMMSITPPGNERAVYRYFEISGPSDEESVIDITG
ncbi:MAG: N-acetylmuramoyl-L-alanine amidase [Candidatus Krumholzibacteriota bacterium]|nr:N-acetylmuramoyl-L-alanine amidase [Candidatus Krumholzibacteriota bacterium]